MNPHAYLFVDGSSARKDDIGGWAAVAVTATARRLLYGVTFPTTISRCELMPIVEGLRWIKQNWACGARSFRVAVYSDSEYTVKTLCGLNRRRKNQELWAALDEAANGMALKYYWRERNTLPYMELCDLLCGGLRRAVINAMKTSFPDARAPEEIIPYGALPDDIDERIPKNDEGESST